MILRDAEVQHIITHGSGCCGKISNKDIEALASSHEELRALIRTLKKESGCWCEPLGGNNGAHTAICNKITRRVI